MKRQNIRKLLLITSLLLFPVTIYYFSPALIIAAGLQGIINGSFFVFLAQFLLSIPFGRLFCAYLCPAGGLQECAFAIRSRIPGQGWKNNIKYIIWIIWIAVVILCYIYHGKIIAVDFFFETQHGISVSSVQSYIIYYGILFLVLIPSILFGKRAFCHYFCWMAPFMVFGDKLGRKLHLPGLHIKVTDGKNCVSCGKCNKECPMGLPVSDMVKTGHIQDAECIRCGACADACPKDVLSYGVRYTAAVKEQGDKHGNREKT